MKKFIPILLMCLGTAGAFAQTSSDGVAVSNDPAKAAAVEQHAQQLKARGAQQAQMSTQAKTTKTAKSKSKAKKKATGAKPTTMK